ncbi:MAG: hypothetical protein M1828_004685 [Chrysothrix sp. TS-e1954]|nr:MAG: hypothetical protein M1828_004685 [Chrysothrix sp. TS-e1954]
MSETTLYILYNADSTVSGKLRYGYKKIMSSSKEEPTCAACDLTHGGLSLTETSGWSTTKSKIESGMNGKVVQWHRDEVNEDIGRFMKSQDLRYPAVLLKRNNQTLGLVMDRTALAKCAGDPSTFMKQLENQGVLTQQASL